MKNKKNNVLMIIDTLGMGGAEVSLRTLVSAMADMGHNVVVLVIKNEVIVNIDSRVHVEVLGYKKYKYLPSLYINAIRLKRSIRHLVAKYGDFQLKVANLTLSYKLSHQAGLDDVYYCLHEDIITSNLASRKGLKKYFRELRIRRLFNGKDIITVSDGVKDSLIAMPNLNCKSIRTIYNPVDLTAIKKLSGENNVYRGMDYIVHVGRFSTEKRHDLLLSAYSKADIPYNLLLVGDGKGRSMIAEKIRKLNLDDKVILIGFIVNPYPIIRDAKLLVLSSDYEGFGVVLAEALCLGTAVVSTDSKSGPGEIMTSSLSEYLVPTGDAEALACKIKKAIEDVDKGCYPFEDACLERFYPTTIVSKYMHLAK